MDGIIQQKKKLLNYWSIIQNKKSLKYLFPLILILLFIFLINFKIHGSSIGLFFNYFYGDSYNDPNLIFGEPRAIRSDEWLVESTLSISQAQVNFPIDNKLFIAGQNFITMDVPIKSWITIFKPQNWGYFFFSIENAFAYKWWFSSIFLTIVIYFYLLAISKENIIVSILLSLSLIYSPFFQWWYAAYVFEITLFGLLTLASVNLLFKAKTNLEFIIIGILISYFVMCYVFVLYPPWQITVFLFLFFIFIGICVKEFKKVNDKNKFRIVMSLSASIIFIISLLFLFYSQFSEPIQSVMNTVYPGNRLSSGGGLSQFDTIGGFYDIQLQKDSRIVPKILGNQSEASSFFLVSLFLIPYLIFELVRSYIKKKEINWFLILGILYYILMIGWGLGYWPKIVGKIFLLNRVPGRRVLLGLGLINHLAIAYFLLRSDFRSSKFNKYIIYSGSIVVFLITLLVGFELKAKWPLFISSDIKIILISLISGILFFLLLLQKKLLFSSIFLFWTLLSTYSVNPLYTGLDPILDNQLSKTLQNINQRTTTDVWIIYDNLELGNYLAANGISTLNGTYIIPNMEFWIKFDPLGNFKEIYNRYAHVIIRKNENQKDIYFELTQNDVFEISIHPCNEIFEDLNIRKFIFSSPQEFNCLRYDQSILLSEMQLYIYTK